MPGFLKFYEGAVSITEYYDMDHADWLRMRALQKQVEQQLRNMPRG